MRKIYCTLQLVKTLLASFFLCIFSLQIIPVKEIGKLLFKGAMTEEIHEAEYGCEDDTSPGSEINKDDDPFAMYKNSTPYSKWIQLAGINLSIRTTISFSKQFIPDIPTPPPNCC